MSRHQEDVNWAIVFLAGVCLIFWVAALCLLAEWLQ